MTANPSAKHDYKVGEILVAAWGYDQTNVEWFRVKEVIGKNTLVICALDGISFHPDRPRKKVTYRDMCCHSKPNLEGPEREIRRVRVNGEGFVKIHESAYARKWDGKPHYESWTH